MGPRKALAGNTVPRSPIRQAKGGAMNDLFIFASRSFKHRWFRSYFIVISFDLIARGNG